MALAPGARLGPYEILAPLGAGGMGEVYRARDSRLKRDVALKILPESVAADPERLARFQREAEVLASLNHPHIAGIHGLEESGGTRALVMELVEGETLADRITRGAIPLDEALPIARQIAEALEAAHERGIIHRDLKPANIKVTPDGVVKVLDFGLAKLASPDVGRDFSPAGSQDPAYMSMSPTITSPAMMTGAGMILGTAAYMSPEQAKGREADKRCDVWAFGCVLYEMLTGRRAFPGDDMMEVLSGVVRMEPDWTLLRADVPAAIRILLIRCLQKDRTRRPGDLSVARLLIEEHAGLTGAPRAAGVAGRRWHAPIAAAVAAGLLVAALGGLAWWRAGPVDGAGPVRRFTLDVEPLVSPDDRNFALSDDGQALAWVGPNQTLYVRRLDQQDALEIAGTGPVRSPFFSPDGAWIGYFSTNNAVKKVSVGGGAAQTIWAGGSGVGGPRGAVWLDDGTIVFATSERASGLLRVPADGGEASVMTVPASGAELDHMWPEAVRGTGVVLFTVMERTAFVPSVESIDVATGTRALLIEGASHAQYVRGGRLLYAVGNSLRVVGFDEKVVGSPVTVLEEVQQGTEGRSSFAVSSDGSLVYLSGAGAVFSDRSLTWVDRNGREETIGAGPRPYSGPRVSPDGTRILVGVSDARNTDVFTYDLARQSLLRLTYDAAPDIRPVWTSDGRSVLFQSTADGTVGVFRKPSDGSGTAERIVTVEGDGSPNVVTADGTTMLFSQVVPATGRDIFTARLDGPRVPVPLVAEPGNQGNPVISPDGRWLAYHDEIDGAVYVRPFPDVAAGRWQVATGSKWPLWSKDGSELFYLSTAERGWALMTAAVDVRQPTFQWSMPRVLLSFDRAWPGFFGLSGPRNYDLSADGQRFLMIKDDTAAASRSSLVFIDNWLAELNARLPPQ